MGRGGGVLLVNLGPGHSWAAPAISPEIAATAAGPVWQSDSRRAKRGHPSNGLPALQRKRFGKIVDSQILIFGEKKGNAILNRCCFKKVKGFVLQRFCFGCLCGRRKCQIQRRNECLILLVMLFNIFCFIS